MIHASMIYTLNYIVELMTCDDFFQKLKTAFCFSLNGLTHYGLETPYGDIGLGQHWLRQWLVAWWHQTITWTNVDLSSIR